MTKINNATIELVEGDITEQTTDAIVNPANRALLGGGGADGAIHRAGGPKILEECRKLGGCDTGDAKITTGGNLLAPYVIHTVGPVYRDGKHREAELLANCYRQSLDVALQNGINSIAFPSISTGAYGYPLEAASRIALRTVIEWLREHNGLKLVRFVLFGQRSFNAYSHALKEIATALNQDEAEFVDDSEE
ncbi:MAG: O-acetyl-ADP-ribose deacetylase [Armatimonadetes bacterium]|nr:O-acetyl-ADP-ribose deacetylase [Armatimonadota bacterium]